MAEIGADPADGEIPGVHPQGRPIATPIIEGISVPAHMPFLTAYAVLNDDLNLTEQQLYTCDPAACPPPTTICDPQLFTIRELLERMRDLGDFSSAQTLIEERYLAENINTFMVATIEPDAAFISTSLVDGSFDNSGRYCDANVSLEGLTTLIEAMTDGTLGDAQSRDDFLEYMYTPAPSPVNAAIDAVIDDEAAEYDLTQAQIQAFKDAISRLWRELAVGTVARMGEQFNLIGVTRRATFAFVGVPFYEASSGTVTVREFSINTYLESEADDASPLHAITAEALRDPIADALDAWTNRPAGCSAADVAPPAGTLDIDDVLTFLAAFSNGDPLADIAPPSGTLDIDDVLTFLAAFSVGCP